MSLNKSQKQDWTSNFKEKLSKASVTLFADYKGMTAAQADDLRKQLRAVNSKVLVIKNNLVRKATDSGEFGESAKAVANGLVGPTLAAFSYGEPTALAKVFTKFAKDNEALQLKDGLLEGTRLSPAQVAQLANLPSREVLLSQLLSVMNGPARGFVTVLSAVPRGFVTLLDAYRKKRETQGS